MKPQINWLLIKLSKHFIGQAGQAGGENKSGFYTTGKLDKFLRAVKPRFIDFIQFSRFSAL